MSRVLHYKVKKGKCITPCPYREGRFIGSIRCGKCVFFNRGDTILNSGYNTRIERKVFSDDDIKGVQKFVNKSGQFTYNKV